MNPENNSDLEKSLAQLSPALPSGLRDHLLFTAGQTSARNSERYASLQKIFATAVVSCFLTFSVSWTVLKVKKTDTFVPSGNIANTSPVIPALIPKKNFSSPFTETRTGYKPLSTRNFHLEDDRGTASSFEFMLPASHSATLTPRSSLDL